jgi:serine/threonine protein kinase
MAQGIQYCHQKGIVHCDVKLENVLVDNGVAKIGDFGLSGWQGTTRAGVPLGTLPYVLQTHAVLHTIDQPTPSFMQ